MRLGCHAHGITTKTVHRGWRSPGDQGGLGNRGGGGGLMVGGVRGCGGPHLKFCCAHSIDLLPRL